MRKLFILSLFIIALISCKKDTSTPNTNNVAPTNPSNKTDTTTIFFSCPGNQVYLQWEDYSGVILAGYWEDVEAPYFYAEGNFGNTINGDSAIAYIYNKGWKRLPYYDSVFNTTYVHDTIIVYNNDTEKIYNYWYIPYKQDSIMYSWPHTAGNRLPENGSGLMVNIYYEGKTYNKWQYPKDTIRFKIFLKPSNSNL